MGGLGDINLNRKLNSQEIIFIVIITFLASFITFGIFFDNFVAEPYQSPFVLGGGSATISYAGSHVNVKKPILIFSNFEKSLINKGVQKVFGNN